MKFRQFFLEVSKRLSTRGIELFIQYIEGKDSAIFLMAMTDKMIWRTGDYIDDRGDNLYSEEDVDFIEKTILRRVKMVEERARDPSSIRDLERRRKAGLH